MNLGQIIESGVIYFLDRNCWNVNDPEALIVAMTVIEEDDKWLAYANQGPTTLQFELSEDFLEQMTHGKTQYLFPTESAARAQYEKEIQGDLLAIENATKQELLQQFFQVWNGKEIRDCAITNAMKKKIKEEFDIYVM